MKTSKKNSLYIITFSTVLFLFAVFFTIVESSLKYRYSLGVYIFICILIFVFSIPVSRFLERTARSFYEEGKVFKFVIFVVVIVTIGGMSVAVLLGLGEFRELR